LLDGIPRQGAVDAITDFRPRSHTNADKRYSHRIDSGFPSRVAYHGSGIFLFRRRDVLYHSKAGEEGYPPTTTNSPVAKKSFLWVRLGFCEHHLILKADSNYRMPSTHSAVISYYAAYFPLACAYDHTDTFLPAGSVWRVFMPPVVVIWATFIALSRIWLGHHTWPQVAVGCLYGIVFAFFWFTLWTSHLYEYGRLVDSAVDSLIRGFR
jgi:hypothetical protein